MRRALIKAEIYRLRQAVETTWKCDPPPQIPELFDDEVEEYVRAHLIAVGKPVKTVPQWVKSFLDHAVFDENKAPKAPAYDIGQDFSSDGNKLRGRVEAPPVRRPPDPPKEGPRELPKEPSREVPRLEERRSRPKRSHGRSLTYHERFTLRVALWGLLGGSEAGPLPADDPHLTDETVELYLTRQARLKNRQVSLSGLPWRPQPPESAAAQRVSGLLRFRSRTELAEERRQRRERHRQRLEEELTRRTDLINEMVPRIGEIQLALQVLVREMIRTLVAKTGGQAEFEARRRTLTSERQALLIHHHIEPAAFELQFDCPACKDTGWLEPEPVRTVQAGEYPPEYYPPEKCECLKREEIEDIFRAAGLQGPQKDRTFRSFRLDIYPAEARAQVEEIVEQCEEFATAVIDGGPCTSLMIEGTAGGGKTHLACAVAHECIAEKRMVVYSTMTDFIEIARMRTLELSDENRAFLHQVLNADLLIIDDLGAEKITEYSTVELTNALNHRLNNSLPMLITTNLTGADIKEHYGERIYSRLVNGCDVLTLEPGIDVRERLRQK